MSLWDDEAGYDRDDPKHPDYADRMFDLADRQRKLAKEQKFQDELLGGEDEPPQDRLEVSE